MASKVQIKYLRSLKQKKYRSKYKRFGLENHKILDELLHRKPEVCVSLWHTPDPAPQIESTLKLARSMQISTQILSQQEMSSISALRTPPGLYAECKSIAPVDEIEAFAKKKVVYLHDIGDPGNLGTIFRTCAWFAIDLVVLSPLCAELCNPKVVHASMGSVFYVDFLRMPLEVFLERHPSPPSLMALDMDGEDVFQLSWPIQGVLVLGSESHGLHTLSVPVQKTLHIPKRGDAHAESLNAATALAIALASWQ